TEGPAGDQPAPILWPERSKDASMLISREDGPLNVQLSDASRFWPREQIQRWLGEPHLFVGFAAKPFIPMVDVGIETQGVENASLLCDLKGRTFTFVFDAKAKVQRTTGRIFSLRDLNEAM